MIVLGIDPGIAVTGYGLVRTDENGSPELIEYGVINATAEKSTSSRLIFVYEQLSRILKEFQPQEVALEKLFYQKNAKTAMAVSEARGVIQLCLAQHHFDVTQYSPNEVKQSVTSYGNAQKKQVQEMVRVLLNLEAIPKPDDAADALAIALCHLSSLRYRNLLSSK